MTANDLLILEDQHGQDKFWDKIVMGNKPDDCWKWTARRDKNGCGIFWLPNEDRKWNGMRAPRLMWVLHHEKDIPEGLQVQHTCDNEECTNPKHLKLGTHKDNYNDMIARGRNDFHVKGEGHPKTFLTDKKVRRICKLYYFKNYKISDIAKMFHVHDYVIGGIVRGKNWRHITKYFTKKYVGQFDKNEVKYQAMYVYFKQGMTFKQVSKKFKVGLEWTRTVIRRIRKANGEKMNFAFRSGR